MDQECITFDQRVLKYGSTYTYGQSETDKWAANVISIGLFLGGGGGGGGEDEKSTVSCNPLDF